MLYNELIKEILSKRGITTDEEITKFLNPSLNDFLNPFDLSGMQEAVDRINNAILNKETILIYGDYDADGVCSVSILYLFLKSKGVNCFAFIPNRHTDGYGLSETTVEQIAEEYAPDLVITVDTGISAKKEIELLLDLGIDCIVTDHHEPPQELPDCIVIDPKLSNQRYQFDGLSGAGVAFKLISAHSGLNEALKYVDICAISTIGDIVPLVDENRIISVLGLKQMNGNNMRPSIAELKRRLKIDTLTSTDVAFKIVPRLNASGRMDSAYKCFEFLICNDKQRIEELFNLIENDNNERLNESARIEKVVSSELIDIDFNTTPAIFIKEHSINLGLIGIIASKLCSQYNRPVFVFSQDENGMLKASIRSVEGINIFEILDRHRDLLIDVGGHSLAGGLTISPNNYEKFKKIVLNEISIMFKNFNYGTNVDYDAEITERHICMDFVDAIDKLEPFGFKNPRPQFLLKLENADYVPMKSYKHYRIITPTKKEIITFFGNKYRAYFVKPSLKQVVITLEKDTYGKTPRAKAILKTLVGGVENCDNTTHSLIKYMYRQFSSINLESKEKAIMFEQEEQLKDIIDKKFGTIVITDDFNTACKLSVEYNIKVLPYPQISGETFILYNPNQIINYNDFFMYKNLVFVDGYYDKSEFNYLIGTNCYVKNKKITFPKLDYTREQFAINYKRMMTRMPALGNDLIDVVTKLNYDKALNLTQLALCVLVSVELGFVDLNEEDGGFELSHKVKTKKCELSNSVFMKKLQTMGDI